MEGTQLAIRLLGFMNAPAIMQRVIPSLQGICVDIEAYDKKRNLLCQGLADAGYDFLMPAGTFYLFPKTSIQSLFHSWLHAFALNRSWTGVEAFDKNLKK
jgi:aspartate aminotransferase